MTYDQLSQYFAAAFVYENVTDEEYSAINVAHYVTVIGGVRYIGAHDPIEALASKQVIKPESEAV